MIYDPHLTTHPLAHPSTVAPPASLTSSYSIIAPEDAPAATTSSSTPGALPSPAAAPSPAFAKLYAQALPLVDDPTMVMPFATPTGHVHLLKHVSPDIAYVQATLAGPDGDAVGHLAAWIPQVVLVVGDDSGHGGLVDSEDEVGVAGVGEGGKERWWVDDPRIGLGKGIEVVEGLRVGEDWRRRVKGHD